MAGKDKMYRRLFLAMICLNRLIFDSKKLGNILGKMYILSIWNGQITIKSI